MDTCSDSGNVDQAVKDIPSSPAEPKYHLLRGCYSERNHENKARETDQNKWSFENVFEDRTPIKKLVKPDVRCEMERAIKKGKQSDHSPVWDETMPARDSSDRCDSEGCDNKTDSPDSSLIGDVGDRIRAEVSIQIIPHKENEGCETCQEDGRFDERFRDFVPLHKIDVMI